VDAEQRIRRAVRIAHASDGAISYGEALGMSEYQASVVASEIEEISREQKREMRKAKNGF